MEEKLYKKYPEYRDTNNIFSQSGKIVLRFKTFKDNKLDNNIPIIMEIPPNINNNNIIKKSIMNYNDKLNNSENKNINKNDNQSHKNLKKIKNMKLENKNNIQNNKNVPIKNIRDNYEQYMNNFDLDITRKFLEENSIIDIDNK